MTRKDFFGVLFAAPLIALGVKQASARPNGAFHRGCIMIHGDHPGWVDAEYIQARYNRLMWGIGRQRIPPVPDLDDTFRVPLKFIGAPGAERS
jgi:hypothetical protein